jgi:hypothetical protein
LDNLLCGKPSFKERLADGIIQIETLLYRTAIYHTCWVKPANVKVAEINKWQGKASMIRAVMNKF